MSHVSEPPTYQILQNGSESFIESLKIFLGPCANLRLVYKGKDLNTDRTTTTSTQLLPTQISNQAILTEHFCTLLTQHLDIPHQTNRIISLATMHYVVPIAVLASLATIGLAAPQNDAGDNSRCGISLFIGDGSPPCNVNTSNKSGGHGQSGDLKIDGECVPQAGSSFGATVYSLSLSILHAYFLCELTC